MAVLTLGAVESGQPADTTVRHALRRRLAWYMFLVWHAHGRVPPQPAGLPLLLQCYSSSPAACGRRGLCAERLKVEHQAGLERSTPVR